MHPTIEEKAPRQKSPGLGAPQWQPNPAPAGPSPAAPGLGVASLRSNRPAPSRPVDQIPNSAPAGWTGGRGERDDSTEFSRGFGNTAAALAPIGGTVVAGMLKGAAKVAAGAASPFVQGVLAPSVPLAAGVTLLNASDADDRGALARASEAAPARSSSQPRPNGPATVNAPALGFVAQRDLSRELASMPANLPLGMPSGAIMKTVDANGRPVYSGRGVGANAPMVDGMSLGFQGGGTVSTVPGMAQGEARAILDRPFDPRNAMSPAQRAQYDSEVNRAQGINAFTQAQSGGRATVGQLIERRLQRGDARLGAQLAESRSRVATNEAQLGFSGRKQDESEQNSAVLRAEREGNMAETQQLVTARKEYLAADTDAKRMEAAKKLMALQGKTEGSPGYTVVPGEEYLTPDGLTKLRGPALVLDNRTGQVVDMSAQIRNGERKGARPEKYELGRTYVVGDRSVRVVSFDKFGQPQFEEVK